MRRYFKKNMTLVSTTPALEPKSKTRGNNTSTTELLTVGKETEIYPDSAVPSEDVKTNRSAIRDLFEQTLTENEEIEGDRFKWVGENEIQVDGLSGMPLHNFVLKAEALGKKVTYRRSIVFTITD